MDFLFLIAFQFLKKKSIFSLASIVEKPLQVAMATKN